VDWSSGIGLSAFHRLVKEEGKATSDDGKKQKKRERGGICLE